MTRLLTFISCFFLVVVYGLATSWDYFTNPDSLERDNERID